MEFCIYNPEKQIADVTDKYVSIICRSLEIRGHLCKKVLRLTSVSAEKKLGAVVICAKHAIEAKKKGYGPIIYWVQGIIPEESYMRRHSKVRRFVLSLIEKKALKSADFILYVSKSMEKHFWKKYHFHTDNSYIMPCFSKAFPSIPFEDDRYKKNIFLYAGRLSAWQCFEETVQLYKKMEMCIPDVKFLVMTPQQEEAKMYLEQCGIKNYEVSYATVEELPKAIQYCKFGFCLRRENAVNHVATPTKLSEYVGNGILPIYSKHVTDFANIVKDNPYCFCVDEDDFQYKIKGIASMLVHGKDVYESFLETFGNYYSDVRHEEQLVRALDVLQDKFEI